MRAYQEAYLSDVVENQGKLFDLAAQNYPQKDTVDFINAYMASKTRKNKPDWIVRFPRFLRFAVWFCAFSIYTSKMLCVKQGVKALKTQEK